jgi:hypothetical protein
MTADTTRYLFIIYLGFTIAIILVPQSLPLPHNASSALSPIECSFGTIAFWYTGAYVKFPHAGFHSACWHQIQDEANARSVFSNKGHYLE